MCSIVWIQEPSDASTMVLRPSEEAELILPNQEMLNASWGFIESFDGIPKLVINARSETISEKEMFRPHVATGRAVIQVAKFGDWERYSHKEKLLREFSPAHCDHFKLACLWRMQDGQPEFVILTTTANELYERIGDRMPCVLTDAEVPVWLGKDMDGALDALHTYPAEDMREKHQEPMQESLF